MTGVQQRLEVEWAEGVDSLGCRLLDEKSANHVSAWEEDDNALIDPRVDLRSQDAIGLSGLFHRVGRRAF